MSIVIWMLSATCHLLVQGTNLLCLAELRLEPLDHLAAWFFLAPARRHVIGVSGGLGGMLKREVHYAASDDRREQFVVLKLCLVAFEE